MSRPSTSFALERGGIGERRISHRGAQVGVEREVLAQAQQARFRPRVKGHLVPFRPAHRAEDHGVGGLGLLHGGVGDGDPVGVVTAAADQAFLGGELVRPLFVEEVDDALHLAHHFRADAVAGEQQEIMGRHTQCLAGTLSRGLLEPHRGLGNRRAPDRHWPVAPNRDTSLPEHRPRVVIVGAGFGGLEAAKTLKRAPADVIVIDRQNHHCFQPLLYQVATAALSPADVAWPTRHILRDQRNATVLMEEVTRRRYDAKTAAHRFRRHRLRLPGDRDRRDACLFRP